MTRMQTLAVATFFGLFTASSGFAAGYYSRSKAFSDLQSTLDITESILNSKLQESAQKVTGFSSATEHQGFTHDNLLVRVNEARLAHGLNQLYDDPYLSTEAQKDLVNNCPVTNHDNFRGDFLRGDFKRYQGTAEDLDSGNQTPLDTIVDLLASPTHADVIIGSQQGWKYIGIGLLTTPVNCVSLIFGK